MRLNGDASAYFSDNGDNDRAQRQDKRKFRALQAQVDELRKGQTGALQTAGVVLSGLAGFKSLTSASNKEIADLVDTATGQTKTLATAIADLQTTGKLNALGDLGKLAGYFTNGYAASRSIGLIDDDDMDADAAWAYFQGQGGDNTVMWVIILVGALLLLYRRADGSALISI